MSYQVTGIPRPVVNWLHNEDSIRSTERTRVVENDDGSHYLLIRNAIIADSGLYICRAAVSKRAHFCATTERDMGGGCVDIGWKSRREYVSQ